MKTIRQKISKRAEAIMAATQCLSCLALACLLATPAQGLVLCKKKSGVIVLRDTCKSTETLMTSAEVNSALCPPDAIRVGPICVDKYEATVWQIPNADLVEKVMAGEATLADLTSGGAVRQGAIVYNGLSFPTCPEYPATFPPNGNWTAPLYAASVSGVLPSVCTTWFQAEQACRLSGKRLLTNAEWQAAAAGTPDPGDAPGAADCNTFDLFFSAANTGSRANCISRWGAFDMVGNVAEWVADWVPECSSWGSFSDDLCSLGSPTFFGFPPGAFARGGSYLFLGGGIGAGVFAVGQGDPALGGAEVGFRCAR